MNQASSIVMIEPFPVLVHVPLSISIKGKEQTTNSAIYVSTITKKLHTFPQYS